jgi:hypothetical protein
MITSVVEFLERVRGLENIADAHDIFENECTDQVRDIIINNAESGSAEPFRSAMHKFGFKDY